MEHLGLRYEGFLARGESLALRVQNHGAIATIERGAGEFRLPWHRSVGNIMRPVNIASKKPYRGVNILILWASADEKDYTTGTTGTYKQWAGAGAKARQSKKAAYIVFYNEITRNRRHERMAASPARATSPASLFSLTWKGGDRLPRLPEEVRKQAALFLSLVRVEPVLISSVRLALRRSNRSASFRRYKTG